VLESPSSSLDRLKSPKFAQNRIISQRFKAIYRPRVGLLWDNLLPASQKGNKVTRSPPPAFKVTFPIHLIPTRNVWEKIDMCLMYFIIFRIALNRISGTLNQYQNPITGLTPAFSVRVASPAHCTQTCARMPSGRMVRFCV
jgi:hypothetical protein